MSPSRLRTAFRILLAFFFVFAGVLHFTKPEFYLAIMPPYLPYHLALVYISGFFEMAGGIGILVPGLRRWAGYGLIALLVAVFPANIHMAVNQIAIDGAPGSPLLLWLRLPLQLVFVAWVWWCAELRRAQS